MYRPFLILMLVLITCVSAYAEKGVVRLRGRDRIAYDIPTKLNEYNPTNNAILMLGTESLNTQIIMTLGPKVKKSDPQKLLAQLEDVMSEVMTLRDEKTFPVQEFPYFKKGKQIDTCKMWIKTYDTNENGRKLLLAVIQSRKYFYIVSVRARDESDVRMGISFLENLRIEKD